MMDVMKNAAPLLIALLLLVSMPAMTVVAGDETDESENRTSVVDAEETPNRLALEGEVRSEYTDTGTDLGAVLASTDDELRTDRVLHALEEDLENASDAGEQSEALERTHDRLTERLDRLEEREREAAAAYAAGNSSDTELMRTLLANHAEAEQLSAAFRDLEAQSNTVPGVSLQVDGELDVLDTYRTPVRDRLGTAVHGVERADTGPVVLEAAEDGYRLSMIDGDEFLSETTRFDHRNTSSSDQFGGSISDAHNHAIDRYPWVFDNRESARAGISMSAQLYQVQATHVQGDLSLYLDGGTASIYQERHHLTIADLPLESERTWSNDGLELSINQTPANGPVKVTVTEDGTDEPVDATVSVDGYEMGETGADGVLWVLPAGDGYEVGVEARGGTVNASVE